MQALAEKTLPEPGNSGAYKAFPDESWEPPTFFMYTKSKLEMLDFTASKDIYSSRWTRGIVPLKIKWGIIYLTIGNL